MPVLKSALDVRSAAFKANAAAMAEQVAVAFDAVHAVIAPHMPDRGTGRISGVCYVVSHAVCGTYEGQDLLMERAWRLPRGELSVVQNMRADPFIVKAPEMWAEHHCVAPLEQWSIGNEAFFVALDDADEALGRAYGTPTATSMDLEWYAGGAPEPIADGFRQRGVVHGRIDVIGRPATEVDEVPAVRWRRWALSSHLCWVPLPMNTTKASQPSGYSYGPWSVSHPNT